MRRPILRSALVLVALVGVACADDEAERTEPAVADVEPVETDEPTPAPAASVTGATPDAPAPDECAEPPAGARTDVQPSGNRRSDSSVDLTAEPTLIDLGGSPVWVVGAGDDAWYVSLADGSAVFVDPDGIRTADPVADGGPPVVRRVDGELVVSSAVEPNASFDDPLPDAVVVFDGRYAAALVEPTDRYAHRVLGDEIEAGAVEILDRCSGDVTRITIEPPSVIEGISPMFADLDGDGTPELIVTTSNADEGARLAAYRIDGELLAASDPIGQGRRWRNQLGAGPTGPNGEIELVDVRTPHIGGIVEFFRLEGDRLELMAADDGYTSHVIGSRNLDMGVLADATGDGRPDVLVYDQERIGLAVVTRTAAGAELAFSVELEGQAVTNIAVHDGAVALGTDRGLLHIWPAG